MLTMKSEKFESIGSEMLFTNMISINFAHSFSYLIIFFSFQKTHLFFLNNFQKTVSIFFTEFSLP